MAGARIPRVPLPPGTRLDTRAVREGLPPSEWGENSEALFLTSSFIQPDAASAAARFANEEEAFIYSRFTNPTVTMFERRLAALEGMEACIATSSGMSAILLLGMGLLKAGDHVICSQSVFGSTIMLFGREFWERVVNFEALVEEGVVSPDDLNLFKFVETAEEAWDHVCQAYAGHEELGCAK